MYYYIVYIIPLSIVFLLQSFSITGPDSQYSWNYHFWEKKVATASWYFWNGLKWYLPVLVFSVTPLMVIMKCCHALAKWVMEVGGKGEGVTLTMMSARL
jgi:hypothetical protein